MTIVARTCTELREDGGVGISRPISEFRERAAYVLLGEPGMGKTTEFDQEATALGDDALFIDARDLASFDANDHPEWQGKTLFIDALDEIRAGQPDPRTPLDRIRRNLDKLGRPKFRLSCRHADWLTTDQRRLEAVSASGEVAVLRLDQLNATSSAELLQRQDGIDDAGAFLQKTTHRGLEGLLTNPQSLELLVRAVLEDGWPVSRTETFEKACLAMAREHNEEHLGLPPPKDPHQVLDGAGHLCAALLISGTPGCATSPAEANGDYPDTASSRRPYQQCRLATASMLFRFRATGRAEPVHRHIAEYIAGRHIAALIEDGLASLRVLALMSGPDGKVVSGLRGLSAWLAACSSIARQHVIERDPIGVALYGDVGALSANEREVLFRALVSEPRQLEPTHKTAPAFASLATPAMLDVFKRTLSSPPTGPDGPLVADFVLRLLRHAPPLPDLAPTFVEIARDGTRWPRIREAALDAFIHYGESDCDSHLLAMLHEVQDGRVDDPDDQFLGKLLSTLYAQQILPSTIWDYFKETNPSFAGAYMRFWVYELPERAASTAVAELLDSCRTRLPRLEQVSDSRLESCVARLLVRGLREHGDDLDAAKLYDWLDLGVRLRVGQHASRDEAARMRRWIEDHADLHLDLLLEGIQRFPDENWYAPYEAFQRLFGATLSADVYENSILAAKSTSQMRHDRAESLVRFVVQSGGLEQDRVRHLLAEDARLSEFADSLFEPAPPTPERVRVEEMQRARVEEQQRNARRALETLKSHQSALRENRAPPALLYGLARAYFDVYIGFTPEEGARHLTKLVGSDAALLDAILTGLRLTVDRDDVPDTDTILELRLQGKMHYLSEPFLAGLAEAEEGGLLTHSWWTEARSRKALAAYFACPHGDYKPDWYKYLIAERSKTVAKVQVQFATALLRESIETGNTNLWHLAFDGAHAKVARHASLPLLREFPTRAKSDHLRVLEYFLLAALRHVDRGDFKQLITNKLSQKSIPPRQRGRWLAAGCAVATGEFAPATVEFACEGREQARTLHVASFFCPQERVASPVEGAAADLPALLVRLVGRFVGPDEFKDGFTAPEMEASWLVSRCIRTLASNPGAEATDGLADLFGDPQLSRWRHALAQASDDQRVYRREYEYRHPTFEQAIETLASGAPAGPGDLAALVLDRLDAMASGIRSGNTDDWKQYWNEDRYGRPTEPKREESCTSGLLRELRHGLPPGVTAEPEARYGNATKADVRIAHEHYHVPIEVKRNDHRDLWHAARTQLITKYASDPVTGGHGIYVVLWFGRDRTQRSPEGRRPIGPGELRQQLEDTLTRQERRTIYVRVIDVSKPLAHGTSL